MPPYRSGMQSVFINRQMHLFEQLLYGPHQERAHHGPAEKLTSSSLAHCVVAEAAYGTPLAIKI